MTRDDFGLHPGVLTTRDVFGLHCSPRRAHRPFLLPSAPGDSARPQKTPQHCPSPRFVTAPSWQYEEKCLRNHTVRGKIRSRPFWIPNCYYSKDGSFQRLISEADLIRGRVSTETRSDVGLPPLEGKGRKKRQKQARGALRN